MAGTVAARAATTLCPSATWSMWNSAIRHGGVLLHSSTGRSTVAAEKKHLKIFAVLYTVTDFGIATIAFTVRVDLLCKTNLLNLFFYSAPFLPNLIFKVHNLPS